MNQSNSLRYLEEVLAGAVDIGNINKLSGHVLLNAMGLEPQPENLVDFFALLNRAGEDAKSILNKPNIERYIKSIDELKSYFMQRNIWAEKWSTFSKYIENKSVLNTLDALAEFLAAQRPQITLEKDFLQELNSELENIAQEVVSSSLDKRFKDFLVTRIEDIKKSIRRYQIDGHDGLEKAIKSMATDLVLAECSLTDNSRENSALRSVQTFTMALLLWLTPSPYDLIGAGPDVTEFWLPKIQDVIACKDDLAQKIQPNETMQNVLNRAPLLFAQRSQSLLCGSKEAETPQDDNDAQETIEVHSAESKDEMTASFE